MLKPCKCNRIGELRFAPPQPPASFTGLRQAREYGPGCPIHNLTLNPAFLAQLPPSVPKVISEDCKSSSIYFGNSNMTLTPGLSINVYRPANTPPNAKLPVLFVSNNNSHVYTEI